MSRPATCPLCGCDRGGTEGGCLQLESDLLAGNRELQIVTAERDEIRVAIDEHDGAHLVALTERDEAQEKLRLAREAMARHQAAHDGFLTARAASAYTWESVRPYCQAGNEALNDLFAILGEP